MRISFFFKHAPTTTLYTLSLHDALPISMLVVPREGDATLVIPRLEAPRVHERPDVFVLRPWGETDDPIAIVASLVGSDRKSTRLNSSHTVISYAVFCLKKKKE